MMELFTKINNSSKSLTSFAKSYLTNVSQGTKYTSNIVSNLRTNPMNKG